MEKGSKQRRNNTQQQQEATREEKGGGLARLWTIAGKTGNFHHSVRRATNFHHSSLLSSSFIIHMYSASIIWEGAPSHLGSFHSLVFTSFIPYVAFLLFPVD